MPLRDTIRLTYGASQHHTAHLWRFAPYGSCYAYGSPLGTPYGSAARLCSRCLRQRGEHTPCLRAMLSLPAATWRAYARFESAPLGRFFRLWRPLRATPYGSFSAYGAPAGRRHTAPSHGYALVAYGNAASIRRALLIACIPRFVAGTSGSGIRGVVQIVP